jgi:CBS domain-containing protein
MQQPNDPRGASVRPPEREFWNEDAERTEDPWRTGSATTPEPERPETWSPRGDDFSSSAAPVGEGSNTPVGDEPGTFRSWDADRPEPSRERFGTADQDAWTTGVMNSKTMTRGAGLAVGATVLGLLFAWWRRRRAKRTRMARLRRAFVASSQRMLRPAAAELPGAVGRAAGKARSPWLPFALLPLALWLRSSGRTGKRASEEMLEPLELEDRGTRIARRAAELVERKGKRLIRETDPTVDRGWSWTPWLLAVPAVGGAYVLARRWMGSGESFAGPATGGSAGWAANGGARGFTGKQVRDVMTRGVEVVSPDTTVDHVAMRMRDLDVGSLPVCDGTRLLGTVTDRDLTVRTTAAGKDPKSTPVRQVMSPEIVWVFEDESAERAAQIMRDRQIRRLPVLDRADRLVGILTLGDLAVDVGRDRLSGVTLEEISQPSRPRRG